MLLKKEKLNCSVNKSLKFFTIFGIKKEMIRRTSLYLFQLLKCSYLTPFKVIILLYNIYGLNNNNNSGNNSILRTENFNFYHINTLILDRLSAIKPQLINDFKDVQIYINALELKKKEFRLTQIVQYLKLLSHNN